MEIKFDTVIWSQCKKPLQAKPHQMNLRSTNTPKESTNRNRGYKYKESYPVSKHLLTVETTDL